MSIPNANVVNLINATLFPLEAWAQQDAMGIYGDKQAIDISPYIMEVYYYESILSPVLTLKLLLRNEDPEVKLSQMVPIAENDVLAFAFDRDLSNANAPVGSNNFKEYVTFGVRSVSARRGVTGLEILSVDLMSSYLFVTDRKFNPTALPRPGKREGTPSSVVESMYGEIFGSARVAPYNQNKALGIVDFHNSVGSREFYYSGLTKSENFLVYGLNLASKARLSEKEAGFLFYETIEGHHFVSIDRMIKEAIEEYGDGSNTTIPVYTYNGLNAGPVENDGYNILSIQGESSDNLYVNQTRANASVRQFAYDPETNQAYVIFLSKEDFEKDKATTNPSETKDSQIGKALPRDRAEPYTGPAEFLGFIQRDEKDLCKIRNSHLLSDMRSVSRYNSLFGIKIKATVNANIDLRAGDFVYLNIPEKVAKRECIIQGDYQQSRESNLYMIAGLCHAIGTDKAYTSLLLVRDKPKQQQS